KRTRKHPISLVSPRLRRGDKAPLMCSLPPCVHVTIVGLKGAFIKPSVRCIMTFAGNRNACLTIGCLILALILGLAGCGPAAPAAGGPSVASASPPLPPALPPPPPEVVAETASAPDPSPAESLVANDAGSNSPPV